MQNQGFLRPKTVYLAPYYPIPRMGIAFSTGIAGVEVSHYGHGSSSLHPRHQILQHLAPGLNVFNMAAS